MSRRFVMPTAGQATPVRFPAIRREHLSNGLRVWAIPYGAIPIVTITLVVARGTGEDPAGKHGLASLTGDLLDEGAGRFDAIGLAEAFARLGAHLDIDTGPDATTVTCSGLSRTFGETLALLASVIRHPRFEGPDFERVRELRISRLRQLSRSAGAVADRTYVRALFGDHAYGHGALGTTSALGAMTADDARGFWGTHYGPAATTLIVAGDVVPEDVVAVARQTLESWEHAVAAGHADAGSQPPDPGILLVDRPGSAQSELRIGHVAPARSTPDYHALVVLNALLGGQFTSRINRRLREEKAITYGARTSFDFRRLAGSFSCDTSVQSDATADAVGDVLAEFSAVRTVVVSAEELAAARASLTRGYVRNFETVGQIARAATQLAVHGLPDDTFDRFVPVIESMTAEDVHAAAEAHVRPDESTVVVVGDAAACAPSLGALGRPVLPATPEF